MKIQFSRNPDKNPVEYTIAFPQIPEREECETENVISLFREPRKGRGKSSILKTDNPNISHPSFEILNLIEYFIRSEDTLKTILTTIRNPRNRFRLPPAISIVYGQISHTDFGLTDENAFASSFKIGIEYNSNPDSEKISQHGTIRGDLEKRVSLFIQRLNKETLNEVIGSPVYALFDSSSLSDLGYGRILSLASPDYIPDSRLKRTLELISRQKLIRD